MTKFRFLTADEVEARVSTINDKGLSLLLYKDARCDMRILDETVGPENWQRKHYEQKGNMFCSVGVKCGEDWIWKDDCGTESYTEKEKGEASDSFKRACFNWGIGRELYTAPFIWIPPTTDGKPNYNTIIKNGSPTTYDRFTVTHMEVQDGKITALNIENQKLGRTVFVFPRGKAAPKPIEDAPRCTVCGGIITPMRHKGQAISAQEAAEVYGKCVACLKKEAGNAPAKI